jgi:hypothetical protein
MTCNVEEIERPRRMGAGLLAIIIGPVQGCRAPLREEHLRWKSHCCAQRCGGVYRLFTLVGISNVLVGVRFEEIRSCQ